MHHTLEYFQSPLGFAQSYHYAVINGFRCQSGFQQFTRDNRYQTERVSADWYIGGIATKTWLGESDAVHVALLNPLDRNIHGVYEHDGWVLNKETNRVETYVPQLGVTICAEGGKRFMIRLSTASRKSNAKIVIGNKRGKGWYFAGLYDTTDLRMNDRPRENRK